jgi:penicillin-binding protein 1A
MKLVEGASTLTQQLIKTMALTREKKIIRKIKEVLLAFRLETLLTKEEILERYLNQVYFGHGYYGIRTAALGYFHKELDQLNLKEIAILVGLPKAPSFYDPTKNLKFAVSRANQVISRLKTWMD